MPLSKELKIFGNRKKKWYDYKKQNYGNSIQNKVAIITGGSSGIGRTTALAFIKKEQNYCVDWHESRKLCRSLDRHGSYFLLNAMSQSEC
jgi:hypothetical protein